ncbi:MAG TPA: hypothetical protein VI454_21035 [Verrucomicrobiae bacterium]|jgi:phosphosulfolactate synthase (CoM biosynthesis protein A)
MNRRTKTLMLALGALLVVWAVAFGVRAVARKQKVTAEKVLSMLQENDLAKLSGAERARVLHQLADKLNHLPYEERRSVRMDAEWSRWFEAMTDVEKSEFLEATMPTGFKQMITAFEQLPPEKRRKTIDESWKRLREAQQAATRGETPARPQPLDGGTNAPVVLNEELRQKVVGIGLKTFFNESSPQTQAEVMPLLEEMQRTMQRGGGMRR